MRSKKLKLKQCGYGEPPNKGCKKVKALASDVVPYYNKPTNTRHWRCLECRMKALEGLSGR